MRDHRKLRAFELAGDSVLAIYQVTKSFPKEDCSADVATEADSGFCCIEHCRRLVAIRRPIMYAFSTAFASARGVEYPLFIAARLGYIAPEPSAALAQQAEETARVLAGLLQSLRSTA